MEEINQKPSYSYHYLILAIIAITSVLIFSFSQNNIKYDKPLYDGYHYLNITKSFKGEQTIVSSPFHKRPLTSYLVHLMGDNNLVLKYKIINLSFGLLSFFCLCVSLIRLKIDFKYIYLIALLYLIHWAGPIRLTLFDPVNTDGAVYLVLSLFLLAFAYQYRLLMFIIIGIGILIKEMFIPLYIGTLLWSSIKNKKISLIIFGLVYGAAMLFSQHIWTSHLNIKIVGNHSIFNVIYNNILDIINKPHILFTYLVTFTLIYGPFMNVLSKRNFFKGNNKPFEFLFYAIILVLLPLIGGRDYSRLLFLNFSVFIFLIVQNNLKFKRIEFFTTLALIIIVSRPFDLIPIEHKYLSSWFPEKIINFKEYNLWAFLIVFLSSITYWCYLLFKTRKL